MASEPTGKPPRTTEAIRAALGNVHGQIQSSAKPGPFQAGLAPNDRLVVASFFDATNARMFQDALSAEGIGSSTRRRDRKHDVLVDYEDRGRAGDRLRSHLAEHPNRPSTEIRREIDYLLFGSAIGITIGGIFGFANYPSPAAFSAPIPFTIVGLLIGHLIDRAKQFRQRRQHWGFGVWDFLVLATLPAALTFLWLYVNRFLK